MKADETKRKREILLGINPCIYGLNYHDPAVVVLIDGRVVFGVEEERCNRVKHSKGVFPSLALAECLTYCNLTWDDIDGGISDPIPHHLAFSEGCEKVVIILTLPKTHFRDTSKDAEAAEKMKKYPAMVPLMRHKSELYNRQLKEALELEEKGKVLIVAPDGYFKGGSLAKDRNQIMQIYEEGYEKARMISDFIYFSNPSGSLER